MNGLTPAIMPPPAPPIAPFGLTWPAPTTANFRSDTPHRPYCAGRPAGSAARRVGLMAGSGTPEERDGPTAAGHGLSSPSPSLPGMNERGWGWSPSQIRQAQLIEWLAQRPAGERVTATGFYEVLEEQGANISDVALGDLEALEGESLITRFPSLASIPGQQIKVTQRLRERAEEMRAKRADRGQRRAQCRDAMVDWLHSIDAVSATPDMPATVDMLTDSRHGVWFAEPFTERDLYTAAGWLYRNELVDAITVDQEDGPIRLHLADAGLACAEKYGSDTNRYIEAQRMPGSGPTVNIGSNSGPFQIAGDHAQQAQHIGASADQLRTMISSIAELVAHLVPDAADVAEQREAALAAARGGAVDVSIVRRFANWALATVGKGATAALVPAVTSGTDDMVREAIRLAGHL